MSAERTATSPFQRLTSASERRTARSSEALGLKNASTRILLSASALRTGLGSVLAAALSAAVGAALLFAPGLVAAAEPVAGASPVASCTLPSRASWAAPAAFALSTALERPVTPGAVAGAGAGATAGSVLGRRKSIHAARRPTTAMRTMRRGGEIWLTVPHIGRDPPDP
jgi:hypothetical protein